MPTSIHASPKRPPLKKDLGVHGDSGTPGQSYRLGQSRPNPEQILRSILSGGPQSLSTVMSECLSAGVSRSPIYRAARNLGVLSTVRVISGRREAVWSIPESHNPTVPESPRPNIPKSLSPTVPESPKKRLPPISRYGNITQEDEYACPRCGKSEPHNDHDEDDAEETALLPKPLKMITFPDRDENGIKKPPRLYPKVEKRPPKLYPPKKLKGKNDFPSWAEITDDPNEALSKLYPDEIED